MGEGNRGGHLVAQRYWCMLGVIIACAVTQGLGRAAAQGERHGAAGELVLARRAAVSSLIVEYEVTEQYTPPESERHRTLQGPGGIVLETIVGTKKAKRRFACLDNNRLWESAFVFDEETGPAGGVLRHDTVKSAGRMEGLTVSLNGGAKGVIDESLFCPESVVELGLGLRMHGQQTLMSHNDVQAMEYAIQDNGDIEASVTDERGRRHVWVFSSEHKYGLRRYAVSGGGGFVQTSVECEAFVEVEGIMLPTTIVLDLGLSAEGRPAMRSTATVLRYHLNSPDNNAELYFIRWPAGAIVGDARLNVQVIVEKDGVPLRDEDIMKLVSPSKGLADGVLNARRAESRYDGASWLLLGIGAVVPLFVVWLIYMVKRSA